MDEQTPATPEVVSPAASAEPTPVAGAVTPQTGKQRGGCLTAWLVLGFLGGILSAISYLANGAQMMAIYGSAPTWAGWAMGLIALAQVAAFYGIWQWQKWGLNLFYGLIVVNVLLLFLIGGIPMLIGGIFGGAIGAGLMYWLTNSIKEQFT